MIATMEAAQIVVVNGDRGWHCPNCNTRLAQIIGEPVVIGVREGM